MKIDVDAEGRYAGPVEIYQLTAPNGKVYIGQAVSYRRSGCHKGGCTRWMAKGMAGRWGEHQYEADKGISKGECRLLNNSIRKYGPAAFRTEVLVIVPKALADHYEAKFIDVMGTMVPGGLNLTEGGGATVHSDNTRKKMSASAKLRGAPNQATLMKRRKERAAISGLPALVCRYKESAKHYCAGGYQATVRHKGKTFARKFASGCLSMEEKLRLAVEARDQILKELGLPAVVDDPVVSGSA